MHVKFVKAVSAALLTHFEITKGTMREAKKKEEEKEREKFMKFGSTSG